MLIYKVRNFFEFVLGGRNLFEIDAEFFRHPFWLSKFFCRSLYSRKNYTMHCRKNSVERKTPCRKNSVVILVFYRHTCSSMCKKNLQRVLVVKPLSNLVKNVLKKSCIGYWLMLVLGTCHCEQHLICQTWS